MTQRLRKTLSSAILRLVQPSLCPSLFYNWMSDTVLHSRAGVDVFLGFRQGSKSLQSKFAGSSSDSPPGEIPLNIWTGKWELWRKRVEIYFPMGMKNTIKAWSSVRNTGRQKSHYCKGPHDYMYDIQPGELQNVTSIQLKEHEWCQMDTFQVT